MTDDEAKRLQSQEELQGILEEAISEIRDSIAEKRDYLVKEADEPEVDEWESLLRMAVEAKTISEDIGSAETLTSLKTVIDDMNHLLSRLKTTHGTAPDVIRTVYPESHISPMDKLSNTLFSGKLTANEIIELAMEKRGSKKHITTRVQLYFSPQLEALPTLSLYDKAVYAGICSVYKAGNRVATDRTIYQAMTGNRSAYLNPKQAEDLNQSVRKLMLTSMDIDMSEEMQARNLPGEYKRFGTLMNGKWDEYNLNGTKTRGFAYAGAPLLLEIGERKDQIARLPMEAIATPVNKNTETITLQTYLQGRIFAMQGGHTERRIAYNTVYSEIWGDEADAKSRTQKKRVRGYIKDILDHWMKCKTADGGAIIKSHREYVRGKTAQGRLIDL